MWDQRRVMQNGTVYMLHLAFRLYTRDSYRGKVRVLNSTNVLLSKNPSFRVRGVYPEFLLTVAATAAAAGNICTTKTHAV